MEGKYNRKSPAVKRLMKEAQELKDPTVQYYAQPLEDNLFEWHFTVRGPPDSEFEGGTYHGRIILPPDYPMKPPSIILLTANGRFELHKKICLSISGHHPESWQPSWSIRTALLAIIGFMPTHGQGAIGSLDYTPGERKILARKSKDWTCDTCEKANKDLLATGEDVEADNLEAQRLAKEVSFQSEQPSAKKETASESTPSAAEEGAGEEDAAQPNMSRNPNSFTDVLTGVRHRRQEELDASLEAVRQQMHQTRHQPGQAQPTAESSWLQPLMLLLGGAILALAVRRVALVLDWL